jgi:5-carboxymethyl-2-hydroxymuconic-semialdehyde dehydrogenase
MPDLQTNIRRAEAWLSRFRSEGVQNHIGGQSVPAADGSSFEIISPIDLQPLAQVARGKDEDINRAAKAAKAAFRDWAAMPGDKRKKLLHKIADAIVARAEEIAFVECMDTGQALKFMAKAALRSAENFRYFADLAPQARWQNAARRGPGQHDNPRSNRPCRDHHAVEHALHAVHLEDRAGARGGLHDCA